ncbi:hypothetical protein TSOC_013341 [Tetrabaena socialis]|uniref:Uncharacterized protein n=1 Tax=Tetrabaena socialis TaxID=47790 RepID=A0A2J7ZKM0_9CHLO|nr:hypothetical protein TSOC_013341 [Tetrabaena socialis]|eukprot:PNH00815.1 hypothetical protein TSOC_013341 [Tetrabaena socialis]
MSYQPLPHAEASGSKPQDALPHATEPAAWPPAQPRAQHRESRADALSEPYAALARPGTWSSGVFDCCALPGASGLCFTTFWCPCWQYGLIAEQLPVVSSLGLVFSRDPDGVLMGGSRIGACLAFFLLGMGISATFTGLGAQSAVVCPCHVPLHLQLRTYMRKTYGLPELSTAGVSTARLLAAAEATSVTQSQRRSSAWWHARP